MVVSRMVRAARPEPADGDFDLLGTARELAPQVAAAADEIDRSRALTPAVSGELKERGFFRLLLPRSLGGLESDLPEFLRVVRILAEADGSTAWCINQNNVFSTVAATMPEPLAREVWSEWDAVVANGPPARAEVHPAPGGYLLTGRWQFSSGCRYATWLAAAVAPTETEQAAGETGLVLLLPQAEVELVDDWQVNGLRGTGSFSFTLSDHFVPASRAYRPSGPRDDGPLYVIPLALLFAAGFGSVALGVARAGLDAAIGLAASKRPRNRGPLRDDPVVHRQVGQAQAEWAAARAHLDQAVATVWRGACERRSLTVAERIGLRLAGTHAIRMAADVVDVAYRLGGADAIFAQSPIQRRFQDIHVITQQIQGRFEHYETAGRFLLGVAPHGTQARPPRAPTV